MGNINTNLILLADNRDHVTNFVSQLPLLTLSVRGGSVVKVFSEFVLDLTKKKVWVRLPDWRYR